MERFDDVSVLASVDESPPPPRLHRRTRRAFTAVVATVVVTGALAGAAVGLADEKSEPSPSAAPAAKSFTRGHECHRHGGAKPARSSSFSY